MRWGLVWIGAVVAVTAITVHSVKTADRPVVVDGVIQGSGPSAPGPQHRAEGHAMSLAAAERQAAQDELAAASGALFAARAAVPITRDDILDIETSRAAAQHRWEVAMERLYGPTWRDKHERTVEEGRQAAEGAASRFGYPRRN